MIYIAYGMNMDPAIMKKRMPDAKVLGIGMIKDHTLIFRMCANIEPAPGKSVPVAVMEISENDEKTMDMFEGYPKWYGKQEFTVSDFKAMDKEWAGRTEVKGVAYVMNKINVNPGRPDDNYLQKIRNGYEYFGLDMSILDEMLSRFTWPLKG